MWHSLSVSKKAIPILPKLCRPQPLVHSPFRIYFTRGDGSLPVHVDRAQIIWPRIRVSRGTQRLPPLKRIVFAPLTKRIVLPALTKFSFKGNSEYLEDMVSRIDTPLLDYLEITFFHQLIFETPLLRHLIGRTEIIKAHYRADVAFHSERAEVRVSPQERKAVGEGLFLRISCSPLDWQLSSLAQVCSSSFPPLYTVELFEIVRYRAYLQDYDIDITQWQDLLYPFAAVQKMVLSYGVASRFAPVLQELAGERATEVLPMLQDLHIEGSQRSKPVEEAIQQFIAARQLSGHPVAVRDHEY